MAREHPRLLRQTTSGHIYGWTPTLAAMADMVPYDTEEAHRRIEALKALKAQRKADKEPDSEEARLYREEMASAQNTAKELTELEKQVFGDEAIDKTRVDAAENAEPEPLNPVKTDEEIEDDRRNKVIASDTQVQRIMGMRKKADVEAYILTEFGVSVEAEAKLETMKSQAINLRTERLFEGDTA